MSTGNPQFGSKVFSKQELKWEKVRTEVEEIADTLGEGIDEGINEAVLAFNINGIPTSQSCEGHFEDRSEHGYPAPWVTVAASNEPKWRYVDEEKIYKQVADEYNITVEQVKKADNSEAWVKANQLSAKQEETLEYKKWYEENKKLFAKVEALLKEFYAGRAVSDEIRIIIEKMDNVFSVHNGGKFYIPNDRKERLQTELTKEERQRIPEVLKNCQKEMQDFADFLKKKYFSDETQS
jgi:hypothetical protein